jgi:hypothetical protein
MVYATRHTTDVKAPAAKVGHQRFRAAIANEYLITFGRAHRLPKNALRRPATRAIELPHAHGGNSRPFVAAPKANRFARQMRLLALAEWNDCHAATL